jgi:hypothetical protein
MHTENAEDGFDNEGNAFWNCNMHVYVYITKHFTVTKNVVQLR